MASTNVYPGIDPRLVRLVRHHAHRVASADLRLEQEDIEQELLLHLYMKRAHYDPSRASRPTFEDRVVRNRAATLIRDARASKRGRSATTTIPPDDAQCEAGLFSSGRSADDTLRCDPGADLDIASHDLAALRLDLSRFLRAQPVRMRDCCLLLVDRSVTDVARVIGCHRSSIYDWLANIRSKACSAGLEIYLRDSPTVSSAAR